MWGAKTALRESFCTPHVGFQYSSRDEDIKIETDRGKTGWGKDVTYFCKPLSSFLGRPPLGAV